MPPKYRTTVASTPSSCWCRSTSSIGRPAVPPGSPSSLAADWPPAIKAQQTCAAPGCAARSPATTRNAASRSATGCTEPMKRLFLMTSSLWTAAASVCATISGALELEDGRAGAGVRQPAHLAAFLHAEGIEHAQTVLAREHLKILEGADANIRRVVPLVGQAARHRHAAARDAQAVGP